LKRSPGQVDRFDRGFPTKGMNLRVRFTPSDTSKKPSRFCKKKPRQSSTGASAFLGDASVGSFLYHATALTPGNRSSFKLHLESAFVVRQLVFDILHKALGTCIIKLRLRDVSTPIFVNLREVDDERRCG